MQNEEDMNALSDAAAHADEQLQILLTTLQELDTEQKSTGATTQEFGALISEAFGGLDESGKALVPIVSNMANLMGSGFGADTPTPAPPPAFSAMPMASAPSQTVTAPQVNVNLSTANIESMRRSEGQLTALLARTVSRGYMSV